MGLCYESRRIVDAVATEAFNDMQEEEVVNKMCLRKWIESQKHLLIHHVLIVFSFNLSLPSRVVFETPTHVKYIVVLIEILVFAFFQVGFLAKHVCDYYFPSSRS